MSDISLHITIKEESGNLFKRCVRKLLESTFILRDKDEKLFSFIIPITFSITAICTALSRTTPFLPTFSLPASNCGFIRHTALPPSFKSVRITGIMCESDINETSTEAKSNKSGTCSFVT